MAKEWLVVQWTQKQEKLGTCFYYVKCRYVQHMQLSHCVNPVNIAQRSWVRHRLLFSCHWAQYFSANMEVLSHVFSWRNCKRSIALHVYHSCLWWQHVPSSSLWQRVSTGTPSEGRILARCTALGLLCVGAGYRVGIKWTIHPQAQVRSWLCTVR